MLGKLGEDAGKIHLAITQGPEPARAVDPALIAGIDALAAVRIELGILHVIGADALVIDVDERQIVELLQQEVRRIVVDLAARVTAERLQEHLERGAVEDVLAGMDFIADIDTVFVIDIKDRFPARRQFLEGFLDQPRRPLRPGVEIGNASEPVKLTEAVRPSRLLAIAAFFIWSTAQACRAFGLPCTWDGAKPSKARS